MKTIKGLYGWIQLNLGSDAVVELATEPHGDAEAMYQRIEAKKWKVASLSIQRQKLFTNLTKFYPLVI